MNDYSYNNECHSVANCDIFDFLAKHVGMTVLHPGGFEATNKLLKVLNITSHSKVIDIACGKGTTAILIAEKYGCHVTAVDIDEKLIEDAKYLTKKKGLENKITYYVGDALKLPFDDNEFDVAVSQGMLALVNDRIKAIQEANRILKKEGMAGWLEVSWKKEVTKAFIEKGSTVLCSHCMPNISTFAGWKNLFSKAGIANLNVIPLDFTPSSGSFFVMMKNEGFLKSLSIMIRIMKNKEINDRIKIIRRFFKENSNVFGCGMYYYKK